MGIPGFAAQISLLKSTEICPHYNRKPVVTYNKIVPNSGNTCWDAYLFCVKVIGATTLECFDYLTEIGC